MKINHWLPDERPREKLLARGAIDVVCVKAQAQTPGGAADFRPTAIPAPILNSIRNTIVQPAARSLKP